MKKVKMWSVFIGYTNMGNPAYQLQVVSSRKPTFDQIKPIWDGENDGVPLHRTGANGEHHIRRIEGPVGIRVLDN